MKINTEMIDELFSELFLEDPHSGNEDLFFNMSVAFENAGEKKIAKKILKKTVTCHLTGDPRAIHYLWAAENALCNLSDQVWARKLEMKAVRVFALDLTWLGLGAFNEEGFYHLEDLVELAVKHGMKKTKTRLLKNALLAYSELIESGFDYFGSLLDKETETDYLVCVGKINKLLEK